MPSWELRYPLPLRYLKKSSFVFLPWKGGICHEVQALLESRAWTSWNSGTEQERLQRIKATSLGLSSRPAGAPTGEVSPEIWRKIISAGWIKWSNGQNHPQISHKRRKSPLWFALAWDFLKATGTNMFTVFQIQTYKHKYVAKVYWRFVIKPTK